MPDACYLCATRATVKNEPAREIFHVECPVCGRYRITREAVDDFDFQRLPGRYILSGLIRRATEEHRDFPLITSENVLDLMSESHLPPRRTDQLDLLLEFIAERAETFGGGATIKTNDDYPVAFAKRAGELRAMLEALAEQGQIVFKPDGDALVAQPTVKGWTRIDELHPRRPGAGNQCFVATWFTKPDDPIDMQAVYDQGFWPAINGAGYSPYKVDRAEHNNRIDAEIEAQIRRSRLLVADVTGGRQGVYFEAGLAIGLGMTVIWSCHKDFVKDMHFDTRQYNHIVWESAEDLRRQLENRIKATAPVSQ